MDTLTRMRAFFAVVENEGFSAAAARTGAVDPPLFHVMDPETVPSGLPREIKTRNADGISIMDQLFALLHKRHRAGTLTYHLVGNDLGARIRLEKLTLTGDDSAMVGHATMDETRKVINTLLTDILGEDGVKRSFTKLDWQLRR
ncbi:hypothetical protein [Oricola sp.]|uniref:hypothetical protein n=1 Tax=Oricola sp. TaxID=1979950 RepID=UPI003BAACB04